MVGSVLSFGQTYAGQDTLERKEGATDRVTYLVFLAHPHTAFFLDGMGICSERGVGSSDRGPCDR